MLFVVVGVVVVVAGVVGVVAVVVVGAVVEIASLTGHNLKRVDDVGTVVMTAVVVMSFVVFV